MSQVEIINEVYIPYMKMLEVCKIRSISLLQKSHSWLNSKNYVTVFLGLRLWNWREKGVVFCFNALRDWDATLVKWADLPNVSMFYEKKELILRTPPPEWISRAGPDHWIIIKFSLFFFLLWTIFVFCYFNFFLLQPPVVTEKVFLCVCVSRKRPFSKEV